MGEVGHHSPSCFRAGEWGWGLPAPHYGSLMLEGYTDCPRGDVQNCTLLKKKRGGYQPDAQAPFR
jgi:hypothetical protein